MPQKPPMHRPRRLHCPERRPSAAARGYDADWRQFRLMVLAERPVCEDCGRASATQVDHVLSLARGGDKYDTNNVRALCPSCHARKTVRCDGGFGRPRTDS